MGLVRVGVLAALVTVAVVLQVVVFGHFSYDGVVPMASRAPATRAGRSRWTSWCCSPSVAVETTTRWPHRDLTACRQDSNRPRRSGASTFSSRWALTRK